MTEFGDVMLQRIAEALEKLNTNLLPILAKGIGNILKEEDSPERVKLIKGTDHVIEMDLAAESTPLPMPQERKIQWIVHEGRKYKACKFCPNLVSWNHDTSNYDHFSPAFKYLYPKCNTGGG